MISAAQVQVGGKFACRPGWKPHSVPGVRGVLGLTVVIQNAALHQQHRLGDRVEQVEVAR